MAAPSSLKFEWFLMIPPNENRFQSEHPKTPWARKQYRFRARSPIQLPIVSRQVVELGISLATVNVVKMAEKISLIFVSLSPEPPVPVHEVSWPPPDCV